MKIRPFSDSDVERVAQLFTAAIHGLARDYYDADQRAAWAPQPPDLIAWRERLGKLETLVAEENGVLIGFISYEQSGHIELLYTSPGHARRGVASVLYRECERALLCLGVREAFTEASLIARPFFERQGFRIVEEQVVTRGSLAFRRYAMRKWTDPSQASSAP